MDVQKKKRKETSVEMRELIMRLRRENKSYTEIAEITRKPRATVQSIIKYCSERDSTETAPRSGRPRKLSKRDNRQILREVNENPRITAVELAKMVHDTSGTVVNPQTVRNTLHEMNFYNRIPRKKPFISKINMEKRLTFSKLHLNDDLSYWNNVIFTDESKFNLFGSDGKVKIWRKNGTAMERKNLLPTVKHGGGSVMVWGCMSAAGVGNLVFIDGIMDRFKYLDILRNNLKQSAQKLGLGRHWIFQQDNDPKHTANVVKEWLLYNTPKQLHSPPQSPDLNPIEHLWDELYRGLKNQKFSKAGALKDALQEAWINISGETTRKLVHSMPNRLRACVEARGGPTKY